MAISTAAMPDDVEALKRLVLARDAELAQARAEASNAEALIAHLRLDHREDAARGLWPAQRTESAASRSEMELELEELEATRVGG